MKELFEILEKQFLRCGVDWTNLRSYPAGSFGLAVLIFRVLFLATESEKNKKYYKICSIPCFIVAVCYTLAQINNKLVISMRDMYHVLQHRFNVYFFILV
jgi:hypothetical protein